MQIELLQQIISEGRRLIQHISLIERPVKYESSCNYVFVGLRQVGKSYMLYARVQQLLREGVDLSRIVFINFDDERISLHANELDQIVQAHQMMSNLEPIFFFDEIQNIEGWEHFARRLANYKFRIYITGSNAKMLSREISTTLGGRYLTKYVYPYTFNEYLTAVGYTLDSDWKFGAQDAVIQRYFNDYLYYGGLPDIVKIEAKRAWLNDMFLKILLSDIIVRNRLRSENVLRMTIRRLAESVMQPVSLNRLVGLIKSSGETITRNTLSDYMEYLRDSCLIFSVENYAAKFSERSTTMKHYFADNGLLNIFLRTPDTLLLENMVATALRKKQGEGKIFFYRENIEVDFIVPDAKQAFQVSWSLETADTLDRELKTLEKFHSRYNDYHLTIIVRYASFRNTNLKDGTLVKIVPVWKWLLNGC